MVVYYNNTYQMALWILSIWRIWCLIVSDRILNLHRALITPWLQPILSEYPQLLVKCIILSLQTCLVMLNPHKYGSVHSFWTGTIPAHLSVGSWIGWIFPVSSIQSSSSFTGYNKGMDTRRGVVIANGFALVKVPNNLYRRNSLWSKNAVETSRPCDRSHMHN